VTQEDHYHEQSLAGFCEEAMHLAKVIRNTNEQRMSWTIELHGALEGREVGNE
jgi:hypothetical protein